LMFIAYFSLFGLFYSIGNNAFFKNNDLKNNPFKVIGTLGTLVLLFVVSFEGFWADKRNQEFDFSTLITAVEFWAAIALTLLALAYLYKQYRNVPLRELPILSPIFLLFALIY